MAINKQKLINQLHGMLNFLYLEKNICIEQMKDNPFCSNTASTTFFSGQDDSFQRGLDKTCQVRNIEMLKEKVRELQCMLAAAINDQNELKDKQHQLVRALEERKQKFMLRSDDESSPENTWYRTQKGKPFFKEELSISHQFGVDHCEHLSKNQFQANVESRQSYFTRQELRMQSSPDRSSDGFDFNSNRTSRFCPSQVSTNYLKNTIRKNRGTSSLKNSHNLIHKTSVPSTAIATIEEIWKEVAPNKVKYIKGAEEIKIGSFLQ